MFRYILSCYGQAHCIGFGELNFFSVCHHIPLLYEVPQTISIFVVRFHTVDFIFILMVV